MVGWRPLHRAAYIGDKECVRLLLERTDIDVNKRCCGDTPLISSIKYKHIECAKLLINDDESTKINKFGKSGGPSLTAWTEARKQGLNEISNLLEADPRFKKWLNKMAKLV